MSHLLLDIDAAEAALNRGESLPASWYTDQSLVDEELSRIFHKTWQYVGHNSRLQNIGDYLTATLGAMPVVIVRNQLGLQGFVNVCRHRRHEVMSGCGHAKVLQCPYHAWTYDLTGSLTAAPRCDRESDFDLRDYSLIPVRVESLGPFVFANADTNASALHAIFSPVLETIERTGIHLDSLQLHSRDEWQSQSNWKVVIENYLECYHCPVAHKSFSAAINVDSDKYRLEASDWILTQIAEPRSPASGAQEAGYRFDGAIREAQYHLLWPNCTVNINPGFPNLSIDLTLPDGPDRCRGFTEQYFAPGVDDKWARDLIAFNNEVGAEDDALTSSVQRGLIGGVPATGRFLPASERLIVHFQKLLLRQLGR